MAKRRAVPSGITEQLRAAILAHEGEDGNTRAGLARLAGIDHSQITRFVEDGQELRLPAVEKLCRALGLELCPENHGESRK